MAPRVRVTRHESAIGRWEMAVAAPAPELAPVVGSYVGWVEQVAAPLVRRELPTHEAPLIINFASPTRLFDLTSPSRYRDVGSFITGAYDTWQLVGSAGRSAGVQIDFTLLGVRLLLGRPLEDLKNQAVELSEVLGPAGRRLTAQLEEAPTWEARFELLDRVLAARSASAGSVPAGVLCAWHRLTRSHGRSSIRSIVEEVGWSHKHLIAQFRHQIGLSPKVFARILRFGDVVDAIRAGRGGLADLALDAGYYDQAHLSRDVRELAGVTPRALIASLLPGGGGFACTPAGGAAASGAPAGDDCGR